MCRNHHDLLEMAVIESLPLRRAAWIAHSCQFKKRVITGGGPAGAAELVKTIMGSVPPGIRPASPYFFVSVFRG